MLHQPAAQRRRMLQRMAGPQELLDAVEPDELRPDDDGVLPASVDLDRQQPPVLRYWLDALVVDPGPWVQQLGEADVPGVDRGAERAGVPDQAGGVGIRISGV